MDNIFGERLKELRTNAKLTTRELAEKIDVRNTSISRWENGKSEITKTNLIKLAQFFGVRTDYLLGLED